jgi:hypothetical protein
MSSAGQPPASEDVEYARMLRELEGRVRALEGEVASFRAAVASEVRTSRVLVVDDDGFERIVLGVADQFGHITVYGRSVGDGSACAELFANDPSGGDGAEVGFTLTDGGDVVAALNVFEQRPPRLWIDGDRSTE